MRPEYFRNKSSPGPNMSEIFGPGGQERGDELLHDRTIQKLVITCLCANMHACYNA